MMCGFADEYGDLTSFPSQYFAEYAPGLVYARESAAMHTVNVEWHYFGLSISMRQFVPSPKFL